MLRRYSKNICFDVGWVMVVYWCEVFIVHYDHKADYSMVLLELYSS